MDLVKLRMAIMMFKAKNNALRENIQERFQDTEIKHHLRGTLRFKQPCVRTSLKSMCISVCGVQIFNFLKTDTRKQLLLSLEMIRAFKNRNFLKKKKFSGIM